MFYVKNPAGRIVCLDKKEEYDRWLTKPKFTKPTPEEIKRWEQYRTRRFKLRQLKAQDELKIAREEAEEPKEPEIFFATVTAGGPDGYGISSQNLYSELKALGLAISFKNFGQKIGFLYHAPYSLMRVEAPVKVIFTMFESTKIPDDWPEYLDEAAKVLVPSRWCQEVFRKSGVESDVVPLGYDHRMFKYVKRVNKRENRKNFVFLHYNAYNIRKGFLEVVKAFVKEFDKDEPVKMVFKTNVRKPPFPFTKEKYPNIEVITEQMTVDKLVELCNNSDCFVFPSRGEGFGMPPLEAMATGMPAILPNAHGLTEFFNAKCMYEVKVAKTCPGIYSRYKGQDVGTMSICSVKHLRQQMRYVYEHQDEALETGRSASEYVRHWTYQNTAKRLKSIFADIMGMKVPERKNKNLLPLEVV